MEEPGVVLDRWSVFLDEMGPLPVSCWSRDEIATWLCGLQAVRARVEAFCVDAASVADLAGVPTLEPVVRTLRQFARVRTNGSGVEVGCDLKLALWLGQFPTLADALRAGRITRRHVEAVRSIDNPRTATALRQHDSVLAEAATHCSWSGFGEVCQRLVVYADPDGILRDERVRRRGVSVKTNNDGTVTGTFYFEPISGAAVKNALEREAARLADCDSDPTHPEGKVRNHRQRMADAMANLITKGAVRPDGTAGSPLVHIVVGQKALEDAMRRAAAEDAGIVPVDDYDEPLPDDLGLGVGIGVGVGIGLGRGIGLGIDLGDPQRRCGLVDGTPLHPATVVGLLGVATLRRIVLGSKSEVLDLGRATRLFPRHLKEALLAAGMGRCRTPGCDAPLAWLQADHLIPWSRGGPTNTTNGHIRCAACNKAKRDRLPHDHHDPPDEASSPRAA